MARRRNFSNWAYWRLQHEARSTPTRARSTTSRAARRVARRACAERLARDARAASPSRCRSTSRRPSRSTAARTGANASCSTPSRRCRSRRICSFRTIGPSPVPRCSRSMATAPASRVSAGCSTKSTTKARPMRTCSRKRVTSCSRPTCAVSASGRLDARQQVPLRLGSRVRDDGGHRSPPAQSVGLAALARRARRAPARRRGSHGRAAGFPTARPARSSSPRSTNGCAPRSSRATCRRGGRRTGSRGTCADRRSCPARSARSSTSTSRRSSRRRPCSPRTGSKT